MCHNVLTLMEMTEDTKQAFMVSMSSCYDNEDEFNQFGSIHFNLIQIDSSLFNSIQFNDWSNRQC